MKDNRNDLQEIPGVGPRIAEDLQSLGVRRVTDLEGADPEQLYRRICEKRRKTLDRCLLYVFRCAVYYASTPKPRPQLLKWWNWKDGSPDRSPTRPVGSHSSKASSQSPGRRTR